jgi:hypothetical protein
MRNLRLIPLAAAVALICAAGVQAAPSARTVSSSCLDSTAGRPVSPRKILHDLDLTRDQKRAVEGRFYQARIPNAHGAPVKLAGLGLTLAQIQSIRQSIIDHTVAAPPGCKPFVNQQRVVTWVKDTMIYNGLRPSVTVYVISPTQIGIRGILDGRTVTGTVAKTGPRQIAINTIVEPDSGAWLGGPGGTFDVGFEA